MMQVNIYTYQTIKGPGTKAGTCTYILETEVKGKLVTLTKSESLEPMSENKAELTVMLKALKRLRKECEVTIYGESNYIKQGAESWLDRWQQGGRTQKEKKWPTRKSGSSSMSSEQSTT